MGGVMTAKNETDKKDEYGKVSLWIDDKGDMELQLTNPKGEKSEKVKIKRESAEAMRDCLEEFYNGEFGVENHE